MNIKTLVVIVASLVAGSAYCEVKIAFADPQVAMTKSQQWMRTEMEVEEDLKNERDKLKELQTNIQAIEEKMQKEGLTMSNEKKLKMSQDRETMAVEFQNLIKLMQKQTKEREQLLLREMAPKVQEAVDLVRQEKGLDVILNRQAILSMKADSELDVTEAVTEKLNTIK